MESNSSSKLYGTDDLVWACQISRTTLWNRQSEPGFPPATFILGKRRYYDAAAFEAVVKWFQDNPKYSRTSK